MAKTEKSSGFPSLASFFIRAAFLSGFLYFAAFGLDNFLLQRMPNAFSEKAQSAENYSLQQLKIAANYADAKVW